MIFLTLSHIISIYIYVFDSWADQKSFGLEMKCKPLDFIGQISCYGPGWYIYLITIVVVQSSVSDVGESFMEARLHLCVSTLGSDVYHTLSNVNHHIRLSANICAILK